MPATSTRHTGWQFRQAGGHQGNSDISFLYEGTELYRANASTMAFQVATTISCAATMTLGTSGQQIDVTQGVVKLTMGTAQTFATTQPTNTIVFKEGTAPVGAITTSSGIFSSSSVLRKIIANGTASDVG